MSIAVRDLGCVYRQGTPIETVALDGVSMDVEPGEWVSLVGHTGSGKSTLARHLNAIMVPSRGSVTVDGLTVCTKKALCRQIRRKVGVVLQYPEQQLFAQTVEEEVAFGPVNWGFSDIPDIVRQAVSSVGLDESVLAVNPMNMSGGQKRRVAIASVIASRPDYLVLDEPTAGLDARGVSELVSLLEKLTKSGVAVVHITHNLELALRHSHRILVLHMGKAVVWGTPEEALEAVINSSIPGLIVPDTAELALKLKIRGMDVPLTLDPLKLTKSIVGIKRKAMYHRS